MHVTIFAHAWCYEQNLGYQNLPNWHQFTKFMSLQFYQLYGITILSTMSTNKFYTSITKPYHKVHSTIYIGKVWKTFNLRCTRDNHLLHLFISIGILVIKIMSKQTKDMCWTVLYHMFIIVQDCHQLSSCTMLLQDTTPTILPWYNLLYHTMHCIIIYNLVQLMTTVDGNPGQHVCLTEDMC